ncbi:MAG TPA: toll/interleukin-1 receptor domain-containing protein, partial [Burkholderiaceae bacterium]|nr:toll/interleukin-1 receptor domain-containing protein [Burkholderiaceae bacterium]
MRSKLFLSYSRADSKWRERFCRQLHALVMPDDLWVDLQSIEGGQDWESRIDEALAEARCALVLVTPAYLDLDSYSRRELGRLAQEQQRGLVLLPVLVADCPWQSVPALAKVQFLRWQGGTRRVPADLGEREELKPLDEAGRNLDRAVVELCEQVKKTLGVVAQTTPQQMDELAADVRRVLGGQVNLDEPIHSGEFSVLYRARLGGEP